MYCAYPSLDAVYKRQKTISPIGKLLCTELRTTKITKTRRENVFKKFNQTWK